MMLRSRHKKQEELVFPVVSCGYFVIIFVNQERRFNAKRIHPLGQELQAVSESMKDLAIKEVATFAKVQLNVSCFLGDKQFGNVCSVLPQLIHMSKGFYQLVVLCAT
jgi:hypothetical protein